MQVRVQQNDTVDLLCWRHYGKTDGVTEAVYAANPGLCEQGPLLTVGMLITLPDITATTSTQQEIIQLWD